MVLILGGTCAGQVDRNFLVGVGWGCVGFGPPSQGPVRDTTNAMARRCTGPVPYPETEVVGVGSWWTLWSLVIFGVTFPIVVGIGAGLVVSKWINRK